jgi:hypothetical protein
MSIVLSSVASVEAALPASVLLMLTSVGRARHSRATPGSSQNGAIFGGAYTRLKPSLPGPAVLRGLLVGLIEHVAAWPLTVVFDRYHPARKQLPKLAANRRAFAQATIRHAVFGIVLGFLEDALNDRGSELTL